MKNQLNTENQRGASVITMMVFVALLTAGAAGLSSMFLDRLKDGQQLNLQQGAEMAKRNVIGALSHDGSWKATIDKQTVLSCLRTEGTVCSPGRNSKLSLFLSDGTTAIIDNSNPSQGFDALGNICNSFDARRGNDKCPFRFTLFWACEGGRRCKPTKIPALGTVPDSPRLELRGKFEYKPKSSGLGFNLNQEFYDFQIIRGAEERDLSSTCKSIGGYFDQGRNHCSVQSTNESCDPITEYMAGISARGVPICRQKLIVGKPCPPRSAAIGLTATGRLICGKF